LKKKETKKKSLFIGIVNRGCPSLSCSTGTVDGASERASNFDKAWGVVGS
jgi:hypothetical protein